MGQDRSPGGAAAGGLAREALTQQRAVMQGHKPHQCEFCVTLICWSKHEQTSAHSLEAPCPLEIQCRLADPARGRLSPVQGCHRGSQTVATLPTTAGHMDTIPP